MFCKNCGSEIKEGALFCQKCGVEINERNYYSNINTQLNNNLYMEQQRKNLFIERIKKCRTANLVGLCISIMTNILLFFVIVLIWFEGPMKHYSVVPQSEVEEFVLYYGLLFIFSIVSSIPSFIIIGNKLSQLSKILNKIEIDFSINTIAEFFNKFNAKSAIIAALILTITSSIIFSLPLIIVIVSINNLKKFYSSYYNSYITK